MSKSNKDARIWRYFQRRLIEAARKAGQDWFWLKLDKGKHAKVDLDDAPRLLSSGPWYAVHDARDRWYGATTGPNGKRLYLHRFIMSCDNSELVVDHVSHDTMDNRRDNLRICTRAENTRNSRAIDRKTTSIYRGVTFDKSRNRFLAKITSQGKTHYLGSFPPTQEGEREAARTYNAKALELHGEFASLNEVPDD